MKTCLNKYVDFSGRATRPEYWWFVLFIAICYVGGGIIAAVIRAPVPILVVALALFLPQLSVAMRRLHDTGKSGWFYLMGLIPYAGGIILIVLLAQKTQPFANQWGPTSAPVAEQIRKLGELRDAGLLNNQEFEAKKAELLKRI